MIEAKPGVKSEPVSPLKISEAMRLGTLTYPEQVTGGYYNSALEAVCAFGAAMVGFGWQPRTQGGRHYVYKICDGDPYDRACPVIGCHKFGTIHDVVVHLNDTHRWRTRQVIDYLERIGL